ncbi:hypothetical protein QLG96_11320, partial [Staphylococcus aureus]
CFKILIFLSTNCGTVYSLNAATVFLCPPYSLAIRGSYAVAFINLCFKILIFLSTNCGTVYSLNAATVFLCPPYSLAIRGSYTVAHLV